MRILLKILFAPVVLALTLLVWICAGLVCLSGMILGLLSAVLCLLAVMLFLSSSVQGGVIYLILAFLASPFGLPAAAFWLLGKVQSLNFAIQDAVYG